MMDFIKKQFLEWHSGIEKKISCHFCSVKLSDEVYSCNFGHDVCQSCKTDSCNACKKPSSFFRNHITEFLISQLNILKSDVELLDDSVSGAFPVKKPEKKLRNKFNQTKPELANKTPLAAKNIEEPVDNKFLNVEKSLEESVKNKPVYVKKSSDEPKDKKNKSQDTPSNAYGIFSCWIGRDCHLKGDHPAILAHVKTNHSEVFDTQPFKGWPHVITWDLNYNGANSREDRAFEIQSVGLFVLHIFISNEQHLKAHILMFDSGRTAFKYRYVMEIRSDGKNKLFSAAVDSSRLPRKTLHDRNKGLFINENSMLQNAIKRTMKYQCTVQITKLNGVANDKEIEDSVKSEVGNNANKDQKLFKQFNRKQLPSKNNANDNSILKGSQYLNRTDSFRPPELNHQQPHLYPNLQKEFNYQHFSTPSPMNAQLAPFYPLPPAFKNENYQRSPSPHNLFVHQPHSLGNQTFVPIQPSAPHIDIEDARNFPKANKPGDFTTTDLERQKLIQQGIEAREKNRLEQSGASTFDSTQEENTRKNKTDSNSQRKKPNECVLS